VFTLQYTDTLKMWKHLHNKTFNVTAAFFISNQSPHVVDLLTRPWSLHCMIFGG